MRNAIFPALPGAGDVPRCVPPRTGSARIPGALPSLVRCASSRGDRKGIPAPPRAASRHAIERYRVRIRRAAIDEHEAARELLRMMAFAHPVKPRRDGAWIWRAPKPRRLRLVVDARGIVVTVLGAFDGQCKE